MSFQGFFFFVVTWWAWEAPPKYLVHFQNSDMAAGLLFLYIDELNFAFDHPRREFVRSFF